MLQSNLDGLSRAFHTEEVNFTLDEPAKLSGAQLARAWMIHPDYNTAKHKLVIEHAWNVLRYKVRTEHKIGHIPIGPGPNLDWPQFEAISLKFDLKHLDRASSEQLAVSR